MGFLSGGMSNGFTAERVKKVQTFSGAVFFVQLKVAGSVVSNGFVPRLGLIKKTNCDLWSQFVFYAGSGVSNGFNPRFGFIKKTNCDLWSQFVFYAGSGGRTRTVSLPTDFESASSANSNIPACLSLYHSPAANASISPNNSFRSLHY